MDWLCWELQLHFSTDVDARVVRLWWRRLQWEPAAQEVLPGVASWVGCNIRSLASFALLGSLLDETAGPETLGSGTRALPNQWLPPLPHKRPWVPVKLKRDGSTLLDELCAAQREAVLDRPSSAKVSTQQSINQLHRAVPVRRHLAAVASILPTRRTPHHVCLVLAVRCGQQRCHRACKSVAFGLLFLSAALTKSGRHCCRAAVDEGAFGFFH